LLNKIQERVAVKKSVSLKQQQITGLAVIAVTIKSIPLSALPNNVQTSYKFLSGKNWQTGIAVGEGIPAGSRFGNKEGLLPISDDLNYYREFGVNAKDSSGKIDDVRFVVNKNNDVYYTDSHYASFIKIEN
jgi:guanyl-specific ribonuclease Sa